MTGRRSWHRRLGQRSLLPATPGKTAVAFGCQRAPSPEGRIDLCTRTLCWPVHKFSLEHRAVFRAPCLAGRLSNPMLLVLVCLPNWLWGLHHSLLLSMFLWSCVSPSESLNQVGQRIAVIYSIMLVRFFSLFLPFFPWILIGFLPHFFPPPSLFLTSGLFKMGLELTTDPA